MRMVPVLAVMAALIGGPAAALSCLPPDVARSYQQAAQSDDSYVVVTGKLTFDERRLPKPPRNDPNATKPDTLIPARMVGHSLSRKGFVTPFQTPITLNARCLGPWCSGAASGVEYLAFLKKEGGAYTLELSPCGGNAFEDPTDKQKALAVACLRGGKCAPQDVRIRR